MNFRDLVSRVPKRRVLQLMNVYPPYLGAGVRVADIEGDGDRIDALIIELRTTLWNRNYVGTAFGGSLYSMADPWFMLLLGWKLGKPYVVWDKAATIDFVKPGRSTLRARFEMPDATVSQIRSQLDAVGKVEPRFETELRDESGTLIARVRKHLHAHKPR
ncbi:MAG: YiiD C-terminal domain-containing protein [Archangium sp.]